MQRWVRKNSSVAKLKAIGRSSGGWKGTNSVAVGTAISRSADVPEVCISYISLLYSASYCEPGEILPWSKGFDVFVSTR